MLIISLDESGSFEGNSKIKLIGGLIYQNNDVSKDTNSIYIEEELKIEEYLKLHCSRLGLNYPNGIHGIDLNEDFRKEELKKAVKEYIKNSGNYYITLMIKSKEPKKSISKANMVDEKVASNLYEIMVWNYINDLLFYNDNFKDENEIILDLATRVIPVKNSNRDTIKRYKELGYNYNKYQKETVFYLTNQQTFKAGITTKMIEDRIDKELNTQLKVRPINYYRTEKDMLKDTTPMLYLADLVCDIIRDYIDISLKDFNLQGVYDGSKSITGNDLLAWAFDNIDDLWSGLFDAAKDGEYISCMEILNDIEKVKSNFKEYYREHWINVLDVKINNSFNVDDISSYIKVVKEKVSRESINSENRVRNVDLAIYIGEDIWKRISDKLCNVPKSLIYSLADSLILAYNHKGNIEKANYFFDICKSLRTKVSRDDYFGTCLSLVQTKVNEFSFHEAIEILLTCSDKVESLRDFLTIDDFGDGETSENENSTKYPLLGKVYSSLGQLCSYTGIFNDARKYFEMALNEFEYNTKDRRFTLSLYINSLLEDGNREIYDLNILEIFKSSNIEDQLNYIIEDGDEYDLLIYVKAINIFNLNVSNEIIRKLYKDVLKNKHKFKLNSHPMQLVLKYLAKIFFNEDANTEYKFCLTKIKEFIKVNDDVTVKILAAFSEIDIYTIAYDDKDRKEKMLRDFKSYTKLNKTTEGYFEDSLLGDEVDDNIEALYEKFTYMYN